MVLTFFCSYQCYLLQKKAITVQINNLVLAAVVKVIAHDHFVRVSEKYKRVVAVKSSNRSNYCYRDVNLVGQLSVAFVSVTISITLERAECIVEDGT
ncbi:hypothetical protein QQP08_014259 [Theobroma cacao]|nr:hypothetical protein QQP08_014259 [Theobroma cacao]